jgi:hypothetical protein
MSDGPGVETRQVFTPSVPAGRSFVGRKTEMKDLRNSGLRVPGAQVLVWGESGAGKSSLVNKVLEDMGLTAVKTACTPDSTFDQLLESAFAGTGVFVVTDTEEHSAVSMDMESTLGSELIGAKFKTGIEGSVGKKVNRQPIARPQLSAQRLASELGSRKLSWVIEDFHKINAEERMKVAHALKIFADEGARYPDTRVIVLGVSTSIDELVEPATNVGSRLVDIQVPPLPDKYLGEILTIGEDLLNLDFTAIRKLLLDTSVGTVNITHALALACCNERDVESRAAETVVFTEADFDEAVQSYARTRSSSLRGRFIKALTVHRKRKYNNPEILLRAITQLPASGGTVGEILAIVHREHPSYPSANATNYLKAFQEEERGSLIRKTNSGEFRFDEPLQHAFAKSIFGLSGSTSDAGSEWDHAVSDSMGQIGAFLAELQQAIDENEAEEVNEDSE